MFRPEKNSDPNDDKEDGGTAGHKQLLGRHIASVANRKEYANTKTLRQGRRVFAVRKLVGLAS